MMRRTKAVREKEEAARKARDPYVAPSDWRLKVHGIFPNLDVPEGSAWNDLSITVRMEVVKRHPHAAT